MERKKMSEETKRKIGKSNSIKIKEYWNKNKATKKQLEFQKNKIKDRCINCGVILKKEKDSHDCKEIRKKMSEAKKGIKLPENTKIKIGISNLGKHNKGENRDKKIVEKISKSMRKRFQNKENRILASCYKQGIKREDWNGFRKTEYEKIRRSKGWKEWRKNVFERDKFACQNKNCKFCKNKLGVEIHPHHIKPFSLYPKLVFVIENGITYCANYHLKSNLHKKLMKTLHERGGN